MMARQSAKGGKGTGLVLDPGGSGAKAEKSRLRAELRQRMAVIPPDLRSTTRWKVANHLRTLVSELSPTVVALYSARGPEIEMDLLAHDLWADGQTVALPRVVQRGHPLVFNVWPPFGPLEADILGMMAATGPEIIPALMVIPMVGYHRAGWRLGQGGGFYDRTLASYVQPVMTIGVCYTELEIKDFPVERHDRRMDYIVTGKEVIICQ